MNEQVEAIRESVSGLTGATFEISEPKPGFFAHAQSAKWFILCPNIDEREKTVHVQAVWENEADEIWTESSPLGDTMRWIEADYGEEGCIEAKKAIDFTSFDSEIRKRLWDKFPFVEARLVGYEKALAKISSKRGLQLRIRYETSKKIVFFYMVAIIDARGLDLQSKIERIRINIEALKEALREIGKFEKKFAKIIG